MTNNHYANYLLTQMHIKFQAQQQLRYSACAIFVHMLVLGTSFGEVIGSDVTHANGKAGCTVLWGIWWQHIVG